MAYEREVFRAAADRLNQRRQQNEQEYARRREQVYRQLPRVRQIDAQMRKTTVLAATTALRRGENPRPALEAIRDVNLGLQKERSELLRSRGYSEDYLNERPICPECRDSGWKGAQMCRCLHSLCTEEQNKRLSSMLDLNGQSFERFRLDYYGVSYSQEYQAMKVNYEICRLYAEKFGVTAIKNLLLFGSPGVGKTFLSACIARTVSNAGFSVVYDTAGQIFSQFEAEKFNRDPEAAQSVKKYLNSDLLILDDLGSEMTTPFVQAALYQLVNSRLVSGKRTVISTNLTPAEIGNRYSLQVASRLTGEYNARELRGPDIRQLKR